MINSFTQILSEAKFEFDATDLADIFWLAQFMPAPTAPTQSAVQQDQSEHSPEETTAAKTDPPQKTNQPAVELYTSQKTTNSTQSRKTPARLNNRPGVPFAVPASPAIRTRLDLARALRPLMRKVPALNTWELDERATVNEIAETQIWNPVVRPTKERWLELDLVIEDSKTTEIWERVIEDLNQVVQYQGAFRAVRTWRLSAKSGQVQIFSRWSRQTPASKARSRIPDRPKSPRELIDPTGQRLIWLVTDCTSALWRQHQIYECLRVWSQGQPIAILQLFPERFWSRTALNQGHLVRLWSHFVGLKTQRFEVEGIPRRLQRRQGHKLVTVPVVSLEVESVHRWSRVLAGSGDTFTPGRTFNISSIENRVSSSPSEASSSPMTAYERVALFRATSSETAISLANLMAAAPVSLPVIDLLREAFRDQFNEEVLQAHVAEVLLSCLLRRDSDDSEPCQYVFWGDESLDSDERVRDILLGDASMKTTLDVLNELSACICRKVGCPVKTFEALLADIQNFNSELRNTALPFAKIGIDVLRRLGGNYESIADSYEQTVLFPPLKNFEFRHAIVLFEPERPSARPLRSAVAEFETATIELKFPDKQKTPIELLALEACESIRNPKDKQQMISAISGLLSDSLMPEIIEILWSIREDTSKALILAGIASSLTSNLLPSTLQIVSSLELSDAQSTAIRYLVPYLPEDLLISALKIADTIEAPLYKSISLARIGHHLTGDLYTDALSRAIAIGVSIPDEYDCVQALVEIAHSLSSHDQELHKRIVQRIFLTAQRMESFLNRANVYAAIASHLPISESDRILSELYDLVTFIKDPSIAAQVLATILPHYPSSQRYTLLTQARDLAQDIPNQSVRDALLEQLNGQWVIARSMTEHPQYIESLTPQLNLNLMEIPAGSFTMGSPDFDAEQPEHVVTFAQPFLLSQTPITQAQWKFIANLPQVDCKLEPDPSYFKGNDCPVEQINWFEATECCARLSQFTGHDYRLPSEAEWEYACRAWTITPFYFGETLSPELANYSASNSFADGPTGQDRNATTDVGSFPANQFGLYDMHGNVCEWCQDTWHANYSNSPQDGSAWDDQAPPREGQVVLPRVLRGGSWYYDPENCRSAIRYWNYPDIRNYNTGLRVVCGIART